MKKLIASILTILTLTGFSQKAFDWTNPQFKVAKAYLYGLDKEQTEEIVINGKLNPTVVDTNGIILNDTQVANVISAVTGQNNGKPDRRSFCSITNHGIVFFDSLDNPIAYISISVICQQKKVHPYTVDHEKGFNILKTVITEMGFPVFVRPESYFEYGQQLKMNK